MDAFFHFMEVLLECVTALVVLAVGLIVIVWRMPNGTPAKEIMRAVTKRVTATSGVALVGLPIQPIPDVDGIYDIGGLIIRINGQNGMRRYYKKQIVIKG